MAGVIPTIQFMIILLRSAEKIQRGADFFKIKQRSRREM